MEEDSMRLLARCLGAICFVALAFSLGRWLGRHSPYWPGLLAGGAAGLLAIWFARWYLPPDNHVAVIYRLDRFHRLVGPEGLTWLCPLLDRVRATIDLTPRRQEVVLEQLLTQDELPIDLRLAVHYRRDLRAAPDFVQQALSLSEKAWDTLARDRVQEVVREQVAARPGMSLLLVQEQPAFRTQLCEAIARRLRTIGVVLEAGAGLWLLDIRPSRAVWKAMEDRAAAVLEGEAAQRRIRALLAEAEHNPEAVARSMVLLAGAAAEVKDGTQTQLVVGPAVPVIGPSGPGPAGVGSEQPSTRARR
ncbi:MAG: SPFH domain-containing protein [Chloroflexia bacterium]